MKEKNDVTRPGTLMIYRRKDQRVWNIRLYVSEGTRHREDPWAVIDRDRREYRLFYRAASVKEWKKRYYYNLCKVVIP
jgi:hypothetical protein